ncbi:MAG TPA: lactoylglutathione lyase [Thermoplasmata archaeon]|nr:lactoylglutathione lyase [Thermoplasmata archaeon]
MLSVLDLYGRDAFGGIVGHMSIRLAYVLLAVRDFDEAIAWYHDKLGFEVRMDNSSVPGLRFVAIAPKGQPGCEVSLVAPNPKIQGPEGAREVAESIGQNPLWVMHTDDCMRTYRELKDKGVKFTSPPERLPWGASAMFNDLYGNPYNLVERPKGAPAPRLGP